MCIAVESQILEPRFLNPPNTQTKSGYFLLSQRNFLIFLNQLFLLEVQENSGFHLFKIVSLLLHWFGSVNLSHNFVRLSKY